MNEVNGTDAASSRSRELRMPDGVYDGSRDELSLFDPAPVPLDAALAAFVRSLPGAEPGALEALRASLPEERAYTLLAFARRSAVFAMRAAEGDALDDALLALAALDTEHVDYRDILVTLAVLYHAARRRGPDGPDRLRRAAAHCAPSVAALIEDLLGRPALEHDLRQAWGYAEVDGPGGPGLLPWGGRAWRPTLDMASLGMALSRSLRDDVYHTDDPSLAESLPDVWLRYADDPALPQLLASARATIIVQGRPRPTVQDGASQQLTLFVVETETDIAAARLAGMAAQPQDLAHLLAVHVGPLFALLVARSYRVGVPAFESAESIRRYEEPIRRALEATARASGD
jgi:hypothetical protein